MEDSNKVIPPSSPIRNNETEIEKPRNSHQKHNKNFMSPTISTASKILNPKKKILSQWKQPILDSKSDLDNVGTSNLVHSDENHNNQEETFVPDSSSLPPYDPVTNYLSPRPKFLLYNPNRKRDIVSPRSFSVSSSDSPESDSSCSLEPETILKQDVQKQEEEEELIEGSDWGFKWVVFKSLIVFSVWFIATMYITSISSSDSVTVQKIEYQDFGNITFGAVSLRSLGSGSWVFDDEFGADKRGGSAEAPTIESPRGFEGEEEENKVPNIPHGLISEEEKLYFELNSEWDYESEIADSEEVQSEGESEDVADDADVDNTSEVWEETLAKREYKQVKLTQLDFRLLWGLTVMTCLVFAVLKNCHYFKRLFSVISNRARSLYSLIDQRRSDSQVNSRMPLLMENQSLEENTAD